MESEEKSIFEEGQILLFDKPLYWTSFDLVNKVRIMIRAAMGIKKIKVGHAGTLDPLATGLMILCTGKATKMVNNFIGFDKEYIASIYLGKTTPSYDLETQVDGTYPTAHITKELVETTLKKFLGKQQQLPPLHSAKSVEGKRAYEYARKGIEKEMKPADIEITEIELLNFDLPEIKIRVHCGKGTYIRSLARDIGTSLSSGAHLSSLIRTSSGPYKLEDAFNLEKFEFFLNQTKQS